MLGTFWMESQTFTATLSMGTLSLTLLGLKPSLCKSRCWMWGSCVVRKRICMLNMPKYLLRGVWEVTESPWVLPHCRPSLGGAEGTICQGFAPLGEPWRAVPTDGDFQTSRKIHLCSSTHRGLGEKWNCEGLQPHLQTSVWQEGFYDGCVSWQRLRGQGCAASSCWAPWEPITHLLPSWTEQAGEWQGYIFLEWPNGFSYISC